MFQGTRRAVGASRAAADDDAGVFSRPASDVGVAEFPRGRRRLPGTAAEDSVRGPLRCQHIRTHRADSVRVLLPDLGRPPDQPRRLLRADVAAVSRDTQLDLTSHPHGYRVLALRFPIPRGKGLGVRLARIVHTAFLLATLATVPPPAAAADRK